VKVLHVAGGIYGSGQFPASSDVIRNPQSYSVQTTGSDGDTKVGAFFTCRVIFLLLEEGFGLVLAAQTTSILT